VHAAVQDHRRQPLPVRLQYALDELRVLHVGAALVVHDDVEPLGPVGLVVGGVLVLGALVGVVGDGPLDVGAGRDALGEDVLLLLVVVAAAADDQQGADRFGFVLGAGGVGAGQAGQRRGQ